MSNLSSSSSRPRRLTVMVTFWGLILLLLGCHAPCHHAWTTTTTNIKTFTQPIINRYPFHMDVETDIATTRPFLHPSSIATSWKPLVIPGQGQTAVFDEEENDLLSSSTRKTTTLGFDVDAILLQFPQDDTWDDSSSHSMSSFMPWKTSIVSSDETIIECTLSPFWEMQVETLEASCQNLQWHQHHHTPQEEDPYYLESEQGQHRMRTWTGTSDEYRHIRLTYVDGGTNLQIFSSICYPRETYDGTTAGAALPILGMEVLQMNDSKRQLGICDFQPLPTTTKRTSSHFEELLAPIRQEAPQLQETMTNRFFDPSRYFSSQTLLGRGGSNTGNGDDDGDDNQKLSTLPTESWLPSFQAYLKTHIDMVQQQAPKQQEQPHQSSASGTEPTTTPTTLLQLHKDYDNYVASCDPAFPMFASIFGPERATRYIYNVLFPLADEPSTTSSSLSSTTKR